MRRKKHEMVTNIMTKEIIRETQIIVKTRCKHCGTSYNEILDKCPNCGAPK